MPTFRRFSALFGIGLLLALGFAPELARAQEAVGAPDGQSLDGQSQRTQQSFQAVYGPNCASREWVWQHTLAIDNAAMIAGPAASDGQDLSGQDDDVQLAFVAVWGPAAAREWLAEHDAALAHHVLPAPVGPIPCPAARPVSGLAISTAHLEEAVAAARNAHLADAHASLNQFRDLWNTSRADLEKLSPMIAEAVQMAYDQAAAVISDPTRPPPQQSEYLPVLQNLLQAVQNANTVLGGGATR